MARKVLIIDDDQSMRWVLKRALDQAGYEVITASTGEEGISSLSRNGADVVLLDLKMPGMDGLAVLRRIKQVKNNLPVILLTAYASVPTAVEAMRLGAIDYLRKPFDVEEMRFTIARALDQQNMARELKRLSSELQGKYRFEAIVGKSRQTSELLKVLKAASETDFNVLVLGESGSGKALAAQVIHHNSARATASLLEVDCASLPTAAIHARLFGSDSDVEGFRHHPGLWKEATGGTVLLRRVETLDASLQTRLLTTVQDASVRVLSTASADLPSLVDIGEFNKELHKVLGQIVVTISPLRERRGDLPILVGHFLGRREITPVARQAILKHTWPGNVAELRDTLEGASALANGIIDLDDLPAEVTDSLSAQEQLPFRLPSDGINLDEVERQLIVQALQQTGGNKTKAAQLLGLTRHTLLYRMEKHSLT